MASRTRFASWLLWYDRCFDGNSGMYRRIIGLLLWLAGTLLLVGKFALDFSWPPDAGYLFECVSVAILVVTLFYNWLFGPHKGHTAHLIYLVLYALMALALRFDHYFGEAILDIVVAFYLAIGAIVFMRYKDGFREDFRRGVRHDYFK